MVRVLHLLLANDLRSAARARRAVEALIAADVSPGAAFDAALLTSELVANAVVHTAGACSLDARWTGGALRVEVQDASPARPAIPDRATLSGLALVDHLARRWGADPLPGGGKVVWFELDLPGGTTTDGMTHATA